MRDEIKQGTLKSIFQLVNANYGIKTSLAHNNISECTPIKFCTLHLQGKDFKGTPVFFDCILLAQNKITF